MTAFEALEYEIGLGMSFRKAILWREGRLLTFKKLVETKRDRGQLQWNFRCTNSKERIEIIAEIDGGGASLHRLPYTRTNCRGAFEVSNNSLASAVLVVKRGNKTEEIRATGGAALEMAGD
jgi:hypothetical protein